jgi:histidinol dehydrogenase
LKASLPVQIGITTALPKGILIVQYREIKKVNRADFDDSMLLQETVRSILEKVRQEGDRALAYYGKKIDDFEPGTFMISEQEAALAKSKMPGDIVDEFDFTIRRATSFARIQRQR